MPRGAGLHSAQTFLDALERGQGDEWRVPGCEGCSVWERRGGEEVGMVVDVPRSRSRPYRRHPGLRKCPGRDGRFLFIDDRLAGSRILWELELLAESERADHLIQGPHQPEKGGLIEAAWGAREPQCPPGPYVVVREVLPRLSLPCEGA